MNFGPAYSSDNAGDGPQNPRTHNSNIIEWDLLKIAIDQSMICEELRQSSSGMVHLPYQTFLSFAIDNKGMLHNFLFKKRKSAHVKEHLNALSFQVDESNSALQNVRFSGTVARDNDWWSPLLSNTMSSYIICSSPGPRTRSQHSELHERFNSQSPQQPLSALTPRIGSFNHSPHEDTHELMDRINTHPDTQELMDTITAQPASEIVINIAAANIANTANALLLAAAGNVPDVPFIEEPSVQNGFNRFVKKQFQLKLQHCINCHEVNIVDSTVTVGQCSRCKNEAKDYPQFRFGHDNDMDPFYSGDAQAVEQLKLLPTLNDIEEMYIAIHNPVMKIFRLKNGQWGFEGNVVNLPQDIGEACSVLPRLSSDVSVFLVRRKTGEEPTDYKNFKIRKNYIHSWLLFLKRFNRFYAHITISDDNLLAITNRNGESVSAWDLLSQHVLNPASSLRPTESNHDNTNEANGTQGGIEQGAIPIEPEIENILETGLLDVNQLQQTESALIDQELQVQPNQPILWPTIGTELLGEFNTPGLLAKSFPCLFPFGHGDPFYLARQYSITLHEAVQHYQRYAVKLSDQMSHYEYPFARNPRFCHYIQNVDERHRIYSQANYCISDSGVSLSLEDFVQIQHDPQRLAELKGKITRYAANITGSTSYFYQRRKELEAVIEQKKPPTVWWTLSYPDFHWEDLHKMFGDRRPNITEEQYRKWKANNLKENPGLVDEFFTKRVAEFVTELFGPNILDASWHWYRFEWQKRLSIHVHGVAHLKSDPGLTTLGKYVYEGRVAARILRAHDTLLDVGITTDPNPQQGDTFLNSFIHVKDELYQRPLSQQDIASLQQQIQKGIASEQQIVAYRDYILSSMNPKHPLPIDATLDARQTGDDTAPSVHPCSMCHVCDDGTIGYNTNMLSLLLNECNRHKCYSDYCLAKGTCRFGFPKPLADVSVIHITEKAWLRDGKNGETKGCLRKVALTFAACTNDRWLNSYFPAGLAAWGGNMDFTILIDLEAIIQYVAKYGNKVEESSRGFHQIVATVIRKGRENDSPGNTLLRSLFTRLTGGREMGMQETGHLSLSLPFVKSTLSFVRVNLLNTSRLIHLNSRKRNRHRSNDEDNINSNELVIKSIIDTYAARFDQSNWCTPQLYHFVLPQLQTMTLHNFCKRFYVPSHGGKKNKITIQQKQKDIVIIYSPDVRMSVNETQYFFFYLMKHCPWRDCPQSIYGYPPNSDVYNDFKLPEVSLTITNLWHASFDHLEEHELPEYVATFIDNIRHDDGEDWTPNLIADVVQRMDNNEADVDGDFVDLCRSILLNFNDADVGHNNDMPEWNHNHDWNLLQQHYQGLQTQFSKEFFKQIWDDTLTVPGQQTDMRQQRYRRELRGNQVVAFDLIANAVDNRLSLSLQEKCILLIGSAGCGKSFIIDAIVTEFGEQAVIIAAYSGKAAVNIGGTTLHSNAALHLPMKEGHRKELSGRSLITLQTYFQGKQLVIIDEFTMVSQVMFYWLDQRCRQGTGNHTKEFGGLVVVLVGDPAQLPPISGTTLWDSRGIGPNTQSAKMLYNSLFKTAIKLVGSNRLDNVPTKADFQAFLDRLRDGKNTQQDFEWFNSYVSEDSIVARVGLQVYKDTFHSNTSNWFFNTNEEVHKHNIQQLKKTGQPISRLNAHNSSNKAKKVDSKYMRNLDNITYLSVDSLVMYTYNSSFQYKIVNGSIGVVKDIVYEQGKQPPDLPLAVIVHFDCYTGPPLFKIPGTNTSIPLMEKFVPLIPITVMSDYSSQDEIFQRTQIPLKLSWGFTAWKGQGSTFKNPIGIVLGDKEKSEGLTYTNISRSTNIENICLPQGITFERLTAEVTKSKRYNGRIVEETRLQQLCDITSHKYNLDMEHKNLCPCNCGRDIDNTSTIVRGCTLQHTMND